MRNLILLLVAVALTGAAGMAAFAGNTASGPATAVACGFGSCFVPAYGSLADSNSYSGPGAGRVEFADCCLAGDTMKAILKGPRGKATIRWTSAGTLNGDCSTGPYADDDAVEMTGGTTSAKFVPISVPGGFPSSSYFRASAGGWVHTSGPADSCGF